MIPAKQLIKHDPANGAIGDCFRATIASLLEMRTEDVPHFMDDENLHWSERLDAWLAQFDLAFMEFPIPDADVYRQWVENFEARGITVFCALCGPSPRFKSEKHSIVGRNGLPVFDPHPDASGLAGIPALIGFLVKRCGNDDQGEKWKREHADELERWEWYEKGRIADAARIARQSIDRMTLSASRRIRMALMPTDSASGRLLAETFYAPEPGRVMVGFRGRGKGVAG